MKLRELEINKTVLPAPMAGYTDSAFREILRRFGAPITFPGLVPALGLVRNPEAIFDDIRIKDEPRPVGVQIFGSDPAVMADAAQILENRGVDMIDINMGCPMKKIVNVGAGAALLREPVKAVSIVNAVRSKISIPLMVKIRSGWDETTLNYEELGDAFANAGIDVICLHPRTRIQMFTGKANREHIRILKQKLSLPVIGNGDIFTPADALAMVQETGCDAVMIGRGIIGNPWLLEQANELLTGERRLAQLTPPTLDEKIDIILQHYNLMVANRGERKGVIEMRKHFVRYIAGIRMARSLRHQLLSYTTLEEVRQFLKILPDLIEQEDVSGSL